MRVRGALALTAQHYSVGRAGIENQLRVHIKKGLTVS